MLSHAREGRESRDVATDIIELEKTMKDIVNFSSYEGLWGTGCHTMGKGCLR